MDRRRLTLVATIATLAVSVPTASAYLIDPGPPPTAKAAKRWVKNWCKLKPGFSRRHVNALMGKPTGHDAESANWVGFGYHLSVFYDEDARVNQLAINDLGMSKKQRARLKCADTRSAD